MVLLVDVPPMACFKNCHHVLRQVECVDDSVITITISVKSAQVLTDIYRILGKVGFSPVKWMKW